jgi:hypothetical protein
MSEDSADELILKMQHLEAQAKATRESEALRKGLDRLKSAAQRLAWESQREVAELEKAQEESEKELEQLREGGVQSEEAPAFVKAHAKGEDARKQLVRARAKLNFALDRMGEAERREYEAFHADVRAETHGQLAEDPLHNKG